MLSVSLEASFTSDGSFDLGATMTELGDDILGIDFGDVEFDPIAILTAVGQLGPPDLQTVMAAATELAAGVDLESVVNLDFDGLLEPLNEALSTLQLLDAGIDLSVDPAGVGLTALQASLGTGIELFNGPLKPIIDLLGAGIPDLDLSGTIGDVSGSVGGLLALVTLLGGLLAIDATTTKAHDGAVRVAGMLNADLAAADARRLEAIAAGDLPDRVAAVDPNDGFAVDRLLTEIADFVLAMRAMQESWALGLGRGEAALVGLDTTGCSVQLSLARTSLDEALLPLVAQLATSLRGWLDPVLEIQLPDPQSSLDQAFDTMLELLDPLREAIDQLDSLGLVETISGATTSALAPISAVADTLEAVTTSVGGALREVGNVIEAIDLQPLINGVSSALQPIVDVLDAIDSAIAAALATIEQVAAAITTGLGEATGAVEDVANLVQAAFGELSTRIAQIDFEAVQAAVSGGLDQVASLLASAQLSPYFDAAIDVIDTTTDVIDAVPFGLLPTDIQQEIVDLSRPVKQIDFEVISATLRGELEGIMDDLNGDVLDEVDAAYQAVIAFLVSIDPGAAIAEFEAGPFAELRAIVDDIDPEALLTPVEEAIAPVRSALDGIDLASAVLDPIAEVFAVINDQLAELDPAVLLTPLVTEVDQVRTDVGEQLRLSSWGDELSNGRDQIVGLLNRLDPTPLAEAASAGAITRLRQQPATGPGLIGTVIGAVSQASGLPAEAASWPKVRTWFGSVNGQVDVGLRLQAAADILAGVTAAVEGLDPRPAVTAASSYHRRLLQAVAGLPADSRLRLDGEVMLNGTAPATSIAALVENRQRYLTKLQADSRVAAEMSVTGLSQVNAVTDGLTDALLPVSSLSDWLRTLAGTFGLGDLDRPWSELLDEMIVRFGPDQLLVAFGEIITALRDKIVAIIDSAVSPITAAIAEIEGIVDLIDLAPIVGELSTIHAGIVDLANGLDPSVILGPILGEADDIIDRVANFDPLDPIRAVVDELQTTITTLFDTVTPSIVFEPIISSYDTVLTLAAGLDVKGLLQPILDALGNLQVQLDAGIDETAVALVRLQDALPDQVEDAAASVSGSVSVGLSL